MLHVFLSQNISFNILKRGRFKLRISTMSFLDINTNLSWKCRQLFTSAAYGQLHFRLDFFIEASNMNPDQTVCFLGEQSDLGHNVLNKGYLRK